LGVKRINLSRELSGGEIKSLTSVAHHHNILTEVFVHGSNCLCFSGICYMSSVMSGNSGNRGRCSQPCRSQYLTTPSGKNFPLNLKDNSAFADVQALHDAGVDALKIEGRIKKFHYVYAVVDAWRNQLQRFYRQDMVSDDRSPLYKIFNRDFSNAYLTGDISKEMFIDNPRDHSAIHLSEINGGPSEENLDTAKAYVYDERTLLMQGIHEKIQQLSIDKAPLLIRVSGSSGTPLKLLIETPDTSFEVESVLPLTAVGEHSLDYDMLYKRLKALNDTEFFIDRIDLEQLVGPVFLSYSELSAISKKVFFILHGSREKIAPISLAALERPLREKTKTTLSVLIASTDDVGLCNETEGSVYFQLPNCFNDGGAAEVAFFKKNKKLLPCFPSVLIGEHYDTAVSLLQLLQPTCILTNNSGIAYDAGLRGIPWIAGPAFNIVNSYSLLCLQSQPSCVGAFMSTELSKRQMVGVRPPAGFELFYSLYHPMTLMTSRQCLFHQVTGCEKTAIDSACLYHCERLASITNINNEKFIIEKSQGNYHRIFSDQPFLNTEIVTDLPNLFSGYFIDLTKIGGIVKTAIDKPGLIALFENLRLGLPNAKEEIRQCLDCGTSAQYEGGI
jgi:putative protease